MHDISLWIECANAARVFADQAREYRESASELRALGHANLAKDALRCADAYVLDIDAALEPVHDYLQDRRKKLTKEFYLSARPIGGVYDEKPYGIEFTLQHALNLKQLEDAGVDEGYRGNIYPFFRSMW